MGVPVKEPSASRATGFSGQDFFWVAAGIAILLVAAYGVFSNRIQEFMVNAKSGEFKIAMVPPSSKNTIPAASEGVQTGGTLSMKVPGVGPVEVKDDDDFVMAPEKGGAIDRNLPIIRAAVIEGKTDIRYQENDSGGVFSVWIRSVDFNQQGERCIHFNTWYAKSSGTNEWGLLRACKSNDGWQTEVDPDFLSLISHR